MHPDKCPNCLEEPIGEHESVCAKCEPQVTLEMRNYDLRCLSDLIPISSIQWLADQADPMIGNTQIVQKWLKAMRE